jgi:hypothetical protein
MLAGETTVPQLVNLPDQRKTPCSLLVCHHLERLDVEVAEAHVPPPSLLTTPCQQAHRLCDIAVEHIEPVVCAWDLGQ